MGYKGKHKNKTDTTDSNTVKTEIKEACPTEVFMESDPDEDEHVIELLRVLDEENRTQKVKAKFAEEENKKATAVAEKDQAKVAMKDKATSVVVKRKRPTKGIETTQAKAEVGTKLAMKTKASNTAQMGANPPPVMKTMTKFSAKQPVARKTSSTRPGKKVSRTNAPIDNWALLAESTLKRKTVAQLTEYLIDKGVTATNDSGKLLKKTELLDAVNSL